MNRSNIRGFTLIELMIGLTLGLFVVGGVIAMFMTSSTTAMNQQRLSQVLENGRYGAQVLADELRKTGSQYCASYANALPADSGVNLLRAPLIRVANTASLQKWMPTPPTPAKPYMLDPGRFVRGSDCDNGGTCRPALATASNDINVVPASGTGDGNRVLGTDVLTVRYLATDGVSIAANAGGATEVDVGLNVSGAPLEFSDGQMAMIANCSSAEIFSVGTAGTKLRHRVDEGNLVGTLGDAYTVAGDSRVFNFSRDFRSVTYYVGLREDNLNPGQLISSLFRIENGGDAEELIEGVERFDVTYIVLDGRGGTHYLNANQVATNPGALACPPVAMTPPAGDPGCLWRGVQAVDVSILVVSTRSGPRGDEAFRYSPDGDTVQSYATNATLPSGLSAGNRLRREFRVYAGFRNLSR
ncbi:MAG: PilW family protein [Rhodanobacteraceae bacterium]|mgnify:FL=1|nr:PilW family protein [Rhodanobacteraceae bacterium]MBL0042505.1 PilW family protein [Xanthomonadales bacterium]MBP6077249.1 PilW family protein [Xanthomonadales bacterium]MBP7625387.1 PilW family protein [Xanthomonadales bacterium]